MPSYWGARDQSKTPVLGKREDDATSDNARSDIAEVGRIGGLNAEPYEHEAGKAAYAAARRQELKAMARARKQKLLDNENLQLSREQLLTNVCSIIMRHITDAQRLLPEATEGAKLFHEMNFTGA